MYARASTPLLLSLLVAATACARVPVDQPPIPFETRGPSKIKSQTSFTVRTFTKGDTGPSREVAGASCVFESSTSRSVFTTPAEVLAPDMGEATPTASIICTHQGLSKTLIMRPYNKTIENIDRNARGVGLIGWPIGLVFGGIVSNTQRAARVPADDIYAYRSTNILLVKEAP